jgi:hypothetical protein
MRHAERIDVISAHEMLSTIGNAYTVSRNTVHGRWHYILLFQKISLEL